VGRTLIKFLDIPAIRVANSSRLWFTNADIAERLAIGADALKSRMVGSEAGAYRKLKLRKDIAWTSASPDLVARYGEKLHEHLTAGLFDMDYLLSAAFSLPTKEARSLRDWIVYALNGLAYDGFTSLRNYHTSIETRRALTAYVCGADNYLDIVRRRWNPAEFTRGTTLAPAEVTVDKLCIPDYYIDRAEVTRIKGLDLAIYLLSEYGSLDSNSVCDILDVKLSAGSYTEEDAASLRAWVEARHYEELNT
jgi:hypothetical protein